jgi:cytochrome b6-f complex iron-sulfur subunit
MAKKELVTKVWIEPGCIVCDACETTSPEVFDVQEENCVIRPEALDPSFTKPRTQEIVDAAEECPVDVIKYETVEEEVAEDEAAPAPEKEDKAAAKDKDKDKEPVKAKEPAKKPEKEKKEPAEAKPAAAEKAPSVAATAKVSTAGEPDPSIAALLKAAKSRGGNAGLLRKAESTPESVEAWKRKDPRELPPDAQQARVMEAARKAKSDPSRRAFIGQAALTTGWVAFGVGTGISIGPAFGRFMMPNVLEEPDPRVRVGKLNRYKEMAPGEVNEDYKPQGIWMIRLEDRIAALNIICTHLGCIPNWLPNDRKFKCPCHGSGFYQNGINFEGPTPRPLERFRILVEDGIVIVDKSRKFQQELGQWDMPGAYLPV